MTWYNPKSWFKQKLNVKSNTDKHNLELYCDNPQCKKIIEENEVTYDKEHEEIYHVGECGIEATVHRTFNSGRMEIQNVDYISREKALDLFISGKLKQSKRLKQKVVD